MRRVVAAECQRGWLRGRINPSQGRSTCEVRMRKEISRLELNAYLVITCQTVGKHKFSYSKSRDQGQNAYRKVAQSPHPPPESPDIWTTLSKFLQSNATQTFQPIEMEEISEISKRYCARVRIALYCKGRVGTYCLQKWAKPERYGGEYDSPNVSTESTV